MTTNRQRASRPHDAAVVELLKADPDFANEYLAAALEEADEPGGQTALLAALRHVAEAQGMAAVRACRHAAREPLPRAGAKGKPDRKNAPGGIECCRIAFGCDAAGQRASLTISRGRDWAVAGDLALKKTII